MAVSWLVDFSRLLRSGHHRYPSLRTCYGGEGSCLSLHEHEPVCLGVGLEQWIGAMS